MTGVTIAGSWHRIEAWLVANAPGLAALLQPPASASAIAAAEAALGVALAPDFVESLHVHDGELEAGYGVFGRWTPLGLPRIVDTWQMLEELAADGAFADTGPISVEGDVRAVWWDPAWVPFAADGSGDLLVVDLHPPDGAPAGQLVLYCHDSPRRRVEAPSLAAWLEQQAEEMASGAFDIVSPDTIRRRARGSVP